MRVMAIEGRLLDGRTGARSVCLGFCDRVKTFTSFIIKDTDDFKGLQFLANLRAREDGLCLILLLSIGVVHHGRK